MYLQITTKCNMSCEHCGFSCSINGTDMNMKTVLNSIKLIKYLEDYHITIGGGEPTIHPKFWEILGLVFSTRDDFSDRASILIITNGKNSEVVKSLVYLGRCCAISLGLSIDDFHEEIDEDIVKLFEKEHSKRYYNESCMNIRKSDLIVPTGRGKEYLETFDDHSKLESCFCNEFIITPEGYIKICGCEDSPTIAKLTDNNYKDIAEILEKINNYFDENSNEHCYTEINKKDLNKLLPYSF